MFQNLFRKRRKIIIGIHGLHNKPPRKLLTKWWRKSIREGLLRDYSVFKPFSFQMVYWSDVNYEKPQDSTIRDIDHPRYLSEPYAPYLPAQKPSKGSLGKLLFDRFENIIDGLFLSKTSWINFNYLADQVLRIKYKDLDIYYNYDLLSDELNANSFAREVIRKRLRNVLLEHKGKKIMLIAHSMGSIIAYDVLYDLKKNIEIDTFVTIGSPLGLPIVISKFFEENQTAYDSSTKRPTPEGIKKWYNFADVDDDIAANDDLNEEFLPNSEGAIPIDKNVYNDYKNGPSKNAHKSFGYLRTPEMSKVVFEY
jgi:hypothetical protein